MRLHCCTVKAMVCTTVGMQKLHLSCCKMASTDPQQSSLVRWGQYSRTAGPPAVLNFSTVALSLAVGFCISSRSSSPLQTPYTMTVIIFITYHNKSLPSKGMTKCCTPHQKCTSHTIKCSKLHSGELWGLLCSLLMHCRAMPSTTKSTEGIKQLMTQAETTIQLEQDELAQLSHTEYWRKTKHKMYLSVLARPCTVCLLRRASRSAPGGRAAGGPMGMPGGRNGGMPKWLAPGMAICMLCAACIGCTGPPVESQHV